MKRMWFLLVALLLGPPGVLAQPSDQLGQIQQILDERAAAVSAGDIDAFLATVGGEGPFVAAQRSIFEGLKLLQVRDYSLKVRLEDWPDLTRSKDTQRHGPETMVLAVRERYRIEGYDQDPVWNDLFLTIANVSGGYRVVSDNALDDLGIFTTRQLWEFGQIQTHATEHFLFIYHPGSANVDQLAAVAEQSIPAVSRAWAGAQVGKVPVLIPKDIPELERLIGATFDVSNFVAFAASSFDEDASDGWHLVGSRIILNPVNFLRHSSPSRTQIMAHELVHIVTRGSSGPFIPAFIDEGLAELTGNGAIAHMRALAPAGRFDRRLPDDWEFVGGGADDIMIAYNEAASAFEYVRQRWGLTTVKALYERIGAIQLEPGTPRFHTDGVMREVLGIGLVEFESEWAAFISGNGG